MLKIRKGKNKIFVSEGNILNIDTTNIVNWSAKNPTQAMFDLCYDSLNALLAQEKCEGDNNLREWYKRERYYKTTAHNIIEGKYELDMTGLSPELKEYQKKSLAYFNAIGNCYLALDMGLGKTLLALNAIKLKSCKKTLIVCPSYLKFNWEEEIKKWFPELTYTVINGTKAKREKQFKEFEDNNKEVLIINYEQIRAKRINKKSSKEEKLEINIHDYIQKTTFDLIVWDECHRLKSKDSQNSQGALRLKSKYKIMMSGTPISKNGMEIWNNLRILDRTRFTSYWKFAQSFFNMIDNGFAVVPGQVLNPKRYRDFIRRYVLRMIKEDVAPELPEQVFIEIPVEMSKKQERIYNKAYEDFIKPSPEGDEVILTDVEKFIRMCQIAQNPCILDEKQDISIVRDTAINLIEDIGEKQIMVACTYIKMSENLQESIKKAYPDRNIYFINSKIKNRTNIVNEFKKDSTGILVTTIKCLAEGANIDCCDNIIMCDIEWNCGLNNQFYDRIHRITSTRKKTYFIIYPKNTVLEYKYMKIQKEFNESNMNLGDNPHVVIQQLSNMYKEKILGGGKNE